MTTTSGPGGQDHDVLTVTEAAARLRISRWTVYDAIRSGEIKAMRLGRLLRVPSSEVRRLLAGNLTDLDHERTRPLL
jgi:excisionase family DNA binding protein